MKVPCQFVRGFFVARSCARDTDVVCGKCKQYVCNKCRAKNTGAHVICLDCFAGVDPATKAKTEEKKSDTDSADRESTYRRRRALQRDRGHAWRPLGHRHHHHGGYHDHSGFDHRDADTFDAATQHDSEDWGDDGDISAFDS